MRFAVNSLVASQFSGLVTLLARYTSFRHCRCRDVRRLIEASIPSSPNLTALAVWGVTYLETFQVKAEEMMTVVVHTGTLVASWSLSAAGSPMDGYRHLKAHRERRPKFEVRALNPVYTHR